LSDLGRTRAEIGDLMAALLSLLRRPHSDRAAAIGLYLRTIINREENAQLDQAGDVSEEPIPLQRVFDLDAYVPNRSRSQYETHRDKKKIEKIHLG
jgi:hypothetical protein